MPASDDRGRATDNTTRRPGQERRRTQRGRQRHRRRLARRGAAGVAVLLVILAAYAAYDVISTRNALVVTRSSLFDAREALADGDLDRAESRVATADQAARRARERTSGPVWSFMSVIPGIGRDVAVVRAVATTTEEATQVGSEALSLAAGFLGDDGELPDLVGDGRIDVDLLRQLSRELDDIDVADLQAAADELAATTDGALTATVRDARLEGLEASAEAMTALQRAQDGARVVSSLLGGEGPRRHLVMVQNSGELRGTGGLIGFLAVLDVADGAVELTSPEGVDPDALAGDDLIVRGRFLEGEGLDEPVDRPEEFAERYDHIAAGSFLASTNADPDLPTVAPVVLDLYEDRAGARLDGVIAIDPLGLQTLQQLVGTLEVPAEAAQLAAELPSSIPPEQVAQTLLVDVYQELGGSSDERRLYQTTLAETALSGLLAGDWDPHEAGSAMADAVAGRHLQVYSRDEQEQDAIERLGVAGKLVSAEPGDDLVAVTANNAAGNKLDVHVAHEIEHRIRLDVPLETEDGVVVPRELESRVQVRNPIDPEGRDPYIVLNIPLQRLGEERGETELDGLSRTWFTQWLPGDSSISGVEDDDGDLLGFNAGVMHGLRAIDHYLEVPAGSRDAFRTRSSARVPVAWDGRQATYAVTLWRQAKGVPDLVDLAVEPPEGWAVVDVLLEGGGQPGGLGPGAPGPELRAGLEDGLGVVRGAMTADARVVVQLEPA